MIPSNTWFPQSLQERAAWFKNFNNKFAELATSLGFAQADVTALAADDAALQFLASSALDVDAFSKGMTAYRHEITEGKNGNPAATLPTPPDFSAADTALPGIFERLDDLVQRIRSAPGYSNEEGEQFGIVPKQSPGKESLPDDRPVLKAKAEPQNSVIVSWVRGQSDGVFLEMKFDNDVEWGPGEKFLKSSADISIPVLNGNLPRAVQFRARFLIGNTPVGHYSDVVSVITIP